MRGAAAEQPRGRRARSDLLRAQAQATEARRISDAFSIGARNVPLSGRTRGHDYTPASLARGVGRSTLLDRSYGRTLGDMTGVAKAKIRR
jgi:hypothetical protein